MHEHPHNDNCPHNTIEAIQDYHATHLIWSYDTNPDFIRRVQALGLKYQNSMSHAVRPTQGYTREQALERASLNLNGEHVVAPWKREWEGMWAHGCANSPKFRETHLNLALTAVKNGADFLQRDEPRGNMFSPQWGGCFCKHCMDGFTDYLKREFKAEQLTAMGVGNIKTFNYADHLRKKKAPVGDAFNRWNGGPLKKAFLDFQQESMVTFHQWWRGELNRRVGRYIPVACNNGTERWGPVEDQFDFFSGELRYKIATPEHLYKAVRKAPKTGKFQVVAMPQKGDRNNMGAWDLLIRQSTAMVYASGGIGRVPWDTYMPQNAPRYFGDAEKFADLFGFVRANAAYLDGYEEAAAFGKGVTNPKGANPAVRVHAAKVYAITRVLPGKADAAVVVHLVDWRDKTKPFGVSLDAKQFFGDRPLKVKLVTPVKYDKTLHRQAEKAKDYSKLVKTVVLDVAAKDGKSVVKVPAISPWALLIVE